MRTTPQGPGIYILRRKSDGTPLYVGATRDLPRRLRGHQGEKGILAWAGIVWADVEVVAIPLPHATAAVLSIVEIGLIEGIGRVANGTGTLINRDAGGGGGHAMTAAELTTRAEKARLTRQLSARAKKAVATRRANAAAAKPREH